MLRYALSSAFLAAALLGTASGAALADGTFTTLDGNWNGSGTITMADGKSERLRCRVDYNVNSAGSSLKQALSCASDSYKFDLASTVDEKSGSLSGYWTEKNRNINGKLSGKGNASEIAALVEASGFIATLSIKTRGDKQTVYIKSPSTDIRDINVSLNRK
jgi:hypothetical protein